MSRKHRTMLALLSIALTAVLLLLGWAGRHAMGRASDEPTSSAVEMTAGAKPRPSKTDPSLKTRDAQRLCEQTAPKVVTLYVTDSPDRSRLLDEYFTAQATGRNVPVSHIKPQPAKQFAGALNVEQPLGHAVCSVNTGLQSSPWMLEFDWEGTFGWRCTSVQGPIRGAYADDRL